MRQFFLPLGVLFFLVGCAGTPVVPVPPPDAAYHWRPGTAYDVTFVERLSHEPRTPIEPPTLRTTIARYELQVLEVDAAGRAHVYLKPLSSEITTRAMNRPPVTRSTWIDRDREGFDLSPGIPYLLNVAAAGVHIVVDAAGRWLRDFRGGDPPPEFFKQEKWKKHVEGLTVYPLPENDRYQPALFFTYIPTDWRHARSWRQTIDFAPHPPMVGMIPCLLDVRIHHREGAWLILEGQGEADGKPAVKSLFGLIQYGDLTHALIFKEAKFEARFDLDLGLPITNRLELRWATQRIVDKLGEIISDDAQVLTFKISPRQ